MHVPTFVLLQRHQPALSLVGMDASAVAFITAANITSQSIANAVNSLTVSLKSAGIWDRCVAIYPMVGGTAAAHKWNLRNPLDTNAAKRLLLSGGWTHSATGALPNGTTGYADTFIEPNEDMPPYSMHGSYYSGSNAAPASARYLYGIIGGNNGNFGIQFTASTVIYSIVGGENGTPRTVQLNTENTFKGLYTVSCYNFDKFNLYRNGTSIGSNTNNRNTYNPDQDVSRRRTIYLGANNSGVASGFGNYECRFASFGYGLSATQVGDLNTAVTAFQTALGRVA